MSPARVRLRTLMIAVAIAAILSAIEARREACARRPRCNCILKQIKIPLHPLAPTLACDAPSGN